MTDKYIIIGDESMGKSILTEKKVSTLNYIKESGTRDGKAYLGRLEGIGADFRNPTRNGRRYPLELWKNVQNSDDFKEGMATLTIFGENDHPETRVDTSIKEVSIVLTDFEIREDEGIVWCGFDILPTPAGHTLKTILDYGSQIGVSSRGLGDEIQRDGETIIDPETYVFYGFDAVVMPAVTSARPSVVESVDRQKLTDRFVQDIEKATTVAELESLKKVVDATKLPELDSLVESIDIKINSLTEGDNISSKLESDLGVLAQENESLKSKITELESELSASNTRLTEAESVLSTTRDVSKSLTRELSQAHESVTRLREQNKKLSLAVLSRDKSLSAMDKRIKSCESKLRSSQSKNDSMAKDIDHLKGELLESLSEKKRLEQSNREYSSQVSELTASNRSLRVKIRENSVKMSEMSNDKRITESRQTSATKKLEESLSTVTKKYIETKCSQEGLSFEHVMSRITPNLSIKEIDKIISEMSDQNRRFAKVPILLQPRTARVVENYNEVSDSDRQTIEFLQNFK